MPIAKANENSCPAKISKCITPNKSACNKLPAVKPSQPINRFAAKPLKSISSVEAV
jgi:hypothetical protein